MGFPSMSLAFPAAPFCETPAFVESASDTDALQVVFSVDQ